MTEKLATWPEPPCIDAMRMCSTVRQHRAAHLPSSSRSVSTAAEAVAAALLVSVRQLCTWCRLRPDNTYLLLDDFGENGAEDTGLTTELGVMSNEEEEHRDQQA